MAWPTYVVPTTSRPTRSPGEQGIATPVRSRARLFPGSDRGRLPIGEGCLPCPSFEGPRECALIGEASQERHLRKRALAVDKQRLCRLSLSPVRNRLECLAAFGETPVQSPLAHAETSGYLRFRDAPVRK